LLRADRRPLALTLPLSPSPPPPSQYTCVFCGKTSVKRKSTGIWNCGSCKKVQTGGSYQLATAAAATVRSNLSRLRKTVEEA
jgi:large subunit ribosomal protein L37Ae